MIDKKMRVWLAASAGVVLVLGGAVAVAASDWGSHGAAAPGNGSDAGPTSGRTANADGTTGRRNSYRGSNNLFLLRFDTDHDGRITRAEVDAGILAQFQSIDTNHDGKLDAGEYKTYEDGRRAARQAWRETHPNGDTGPDPERPSTFDPMKRLDWNLDGFISLEEFGGRTHGAAMRADKDGDGVILVEDLLKPSSTRTASSQ